MQPARGRIICVRQGPAQWWWSSLPAGIGMALARPTPPSFARCGRRLVPAACPLPPAASPTIVAHRPASPAAPDDITFCNPQLRLSSSRLGFSFSLRCSAALAHPFFVHTRPPLYASPRLYDSRLPDTHTFGYRLWQAPFCSTWHTQNSHGGRTIVSARMI